MKEKYIKIKVYTFKELNERIQKEVKQRLLMFFKDNVNKNTLFLRDGTFFDKESLKFKGLKDFEILDKTEWKK